MNARRSALRQWPKNSGFATVPRPRLAQGIGITTRLMLVMAYPFLPGSDDALAVTLSAMVQV